MICPVSLKNTVLKVKQQITNLSFQLNKKLENRSEKSVLRYGLVRLNAIKKNQKDVSECIEFHACMYVYACVCRTWNHLVDNWNSND